MSRTVLPQNEKKSIHIALTGNFSLQKEGRPCLTEANDPAQDQARQLLALLILAQTFLKTRQAAPYYGEIITEDPVQNQFIKPEWLCRCLFSLADDAPCSSADLERLRYLLNSVLNPLLSILLNLPKEDGRPSRRSRLGIQLDLEHCRIDLTDDKIEQPLLQDWNYPWLERPEIQEIADRIDRSFLVRQAQTLDEVANLWHEARNNKDYAAIRQYRTEALDCIEKSACRALHNRRVLNPFLTLSKWWQELQGSIELASCMSRLMESFHTEMLPFLFPAPTDNRRNTMPSPLSYSTETQDEVVLEMLFQRDFASYSAEDLQALIKRAQEICTETVLLRIISIKSGSVRIRLGVSPQVAQQLKQAMEDGKFQDLAGQTAEIVRDPVPMDLVPDRMPERLSALSALDLNLLITALDADLSVSESAGTADRVLALLQWAEERDGRLLEITRTATSLFKTFDLPRRVAPPHPIVIALHALIEKQESSAIVPIAWWEWIRQGVNNLGVALQTQVLQGQSGRVIAFPDLAQPGLQLEYGLETRGGHIIDGEGSALVVAEGISDSWVIAEETRVTITLLDIPSSQFPFVLLMPEDQPDSIRVTQASMTEYGEIEATFDGVAPGKYLLAIEPTSLPEFERLQATGLPNRISPALIRHIEEIWSSSESELLQEMGRSVLSRGFNASEVSPDEEEEEGQDYLDRTLPSLRAALCDDAQIRRMRTNSDPSQPVRQIAYLADLIRTLKTDVEPETLAAYLVKVGLQSLCL